MTRRRRECPAEECGAGVFMAAHWDRQYCGKCGLTYVFTNPEDEDGDLQQIQDPGWLIRKDVK